MKYSAAKNSATLKSGLGVVQGHWKWRRSIYDFLLVRYCKYSSIVYRFWVIWRRIMSWPWNLGQRSLKIIQNGIIRKLGCGFLFHSNYGSVLHQCRYKARYWSQIVIFIPPLHLTPPLGGPRRNIVISFGTEKLEWWGYPTVEKLWGYVQSFRHNTGVWQTDRQTDIHLATTQSALCIYVAR